VTPKAMGLAAEIGSHGHRTLWAWYLALTVAGGGVFVLPTVRPTVGWGLVYVALCLLCMAAVLLGVRLNRPARPLPWYLLVVGYGLLTAGVAVWYPYVVWTGTVLAYPSIADGLFLASYAVLLTGLIVLIRSRSAGRDRAGLLDAAIMASGMGMLAWVYLIEPQLRGSTLSPAGQAATIAYPIVDLVLVGILARMAFSPSVRRPAFWLLSLGLLAQLAADVIYTVTALNGRSTFTGAALGCYTLSWALVGAAALHPSMTSLSDPAGRDDERGERWRLVPLALAALTPSAVGILQSVTGRP
jgi:diguanylate cyclase